MTNPAETAVAAGAVVLTSPRVRARDFEQPWLAARAREMDEKLNVHRKLWEFCLIAQAYQERFPQGGGRILGFGVGLEPLPAWFAARGASVLATDLAPDEAGEKWTGTGQNASELEALVRPAIGREEDFFARAEFRPVDMRAIPEELRQGGFDFTWSAGSLEHLGGLDAGIEFVCRQMECLRPGGVAVHTTELNVSRERCTLNLGDLCFYRELDLERLAARLAEQGDLLLPLDLAAGDLEADLVVDVPPYEQGPAHLRLRGGGNFEFTSVALMVIRGGARSASDSPVFLSRTFPERKPRALWVGDAVVQTGFARCTHAACGALHEGGWDVRVLGLSHYGDTYAYPYEILPAYQPLDGGRDGYGLGRIASQVERFEPDVVVLLNDPWNVPAYLDTLKQFRDQAAEMGIAFEIPPVIGWLAVDALNQHGEPLNRLAHVVTWTRFAAEELKRGGYEGEPAIVPLGVNSELFRPVDKAAARRSVFPATIPADAYVVGVVGRNQPRKRIDLIIQYFAEWIKLHHVEDAYLYLHAAPTGEVGCNIKSIVRYYELGSRVILSEPKVGHGYDETVLPLVYGAMDVYATTTQGEGWGLPTLEAMACGVPCIVPNWSALGDWPGAAVAKVPCGSTALNSPINGNPYTIGGIADKKAFVKELDAMYRSAQHREAYRKRGLALAATLTWERTGRAMVEVLEQVVRGEVEEALGAAEAAEGVA